MRKALPIFLLSLLIATTSQAVPVTISGVVVHQDGRRAGGVQVGLYSGERKEKAYEVVYTSEFGVYNLWTENFLGKPTTVFVRYEGEEYNVAPAKVKLVQSESVYRANCRDLVLMPKSPDLGSANPQQAGAHLAAFVDARGFEAMIGLREGEQANELVRQEIARVAAKTKIPAEQLFTEVVGRIELTNAPLPVLNKDKFLLAARVDSIPRTPRGPEFSESLEKLAFRDPAGDDYGPGTYTYPTDAAYKHGSFDLTGFDIQAKEGKVNFDVTFSSPLEDPWGMNVGFATQMIFIFIDNKEGGFTDTVPGLNVKFADTDGWDKLVILSPQPSGLVRTEVEQKVPADRAGAVVIPGRVKGAGWTISASVPLDALGGGDPYQWGYQVVVQSNEGFPEGKDLLTRKVNEYEGQHRFGGGTDSDCEPNVIDILAGSGRGIPQEAEEQRRMLFYECNPDGSTKQTPDLRMVRINNYQG